eukprot:scaffold136124_cov44-Attheya_sp.AAC.1
MSSLLPPPSSGANKNKKKKASRLKKMKRIMIIPRILVALMFAIPLYLNVRTIRSIGGDFETISSSFLDAPTLKRPENGRGKLNRNDTNSNSNSSNKKVMDYRHESFVFQKMLERAKGNLGFCDSLPPADKNTPKQMVEMVTNVSAMSEFGIIQAVDTWFGEQEKKQPPDRDVCYLPPSKSCNATSYSVILMSHTTERLQPMKRGIDGLSNRKLTAEIILVWNSNRTVLASHDIGKTLMGYCADKDHPFRIFYSLEMGLPNSLLNRYHPMIQPAHEAVVFFDDDGPFFPESAMAAGFELWKRNSGVEVGCMPRQFKFSTNKRMKERQKVETEKSIQQVTEGWQSVSPYDSIQRKQGQDHPGFIPRCHGHTNEGVNVLEYNYFDFMDFHAHMVLPSGSFLHRNFLCFIWHPLFQEIRDFILRHPTHPDDMTVSLNRKSDFYDCGKKSPSNRIPWLQKGGLGHDQC